MFIVTVAAVARGFLVEMAQEVAPQQSQQASKRGRKRKA